MEENMATRSLRIDEALVIQAQRHARVEHRSINGQVEYWAKLGKAIASKISMADAFAVIQGLKEIHLETSKSIPVDTDTVFKTLEADRAQRFSGKPITSAPFYFEASISKPGFLDKVDTVTGERQTGRFQNGKFEAL
jgi:ParD-like antitoxin of type II bacterial toxin-antitoxin system